MHMHIDGMQLHVTYVAVSGWCQGSSKGAFCLTSTRFSNDSHLRSTVSLQDVEIESFHAANSKGGTWMRRSLESSEERFFGVLKKTFERQGAELYTRIRIAQSGVRKKVLVAPELKHQSPSGRGHYLHAFFVSELKHNILLMAEILHQLICSCPIIYRFYTSHPRWCRISAINSITQFGKF